MKLSAYRVFRDWHTARDRLNPTHKTPKQDRTFDRMLLLARTSIAIGLWIIVLNQFFNLLTGD